MKKKKRMILSLLCILLLILLSVSAATVSYLLPYSQVTMDMSLLALSVHGTPAVLYAADPEDKKVYHPVAEGVPIEVKKQIRVTYDQLPKELIYAFVAIEDKRFFEHEGVDVYRTLHAVWDYATHGGEGSFGGSTITQQLVKNLTGNTDRTPDRKLREIFMALDLERKTDKQTVLEVYANVINMGSGCMGVGAASECYFGKCVEELSLGECAALAAITNNPTRYNPRTQPENNLRRREIILREMMTQGYIAEKEYAQAISTPLELCAEDRTKPPMTSWYTEMVMSDVLRDLQEQLGYSYETAAFLLSNGGLRIETTMDEDLQKIVTAYYENEANFPVGASGRPQSAMILIDPRDGAILAVAGAIGKKEAYYLQNYATQTRRPAGSAIKPLSVYAPALKRGMITSGSVFEDAPQEEKNGRPWPKNADNLYRGRVTVRDSIAHSLNTVSVEILNQVGLKNSFDFLHDTLHMESLIPSESEPLHDLTLASLALGQQSRGVTIRELTAGYTIFHAGAYHEPISYRRVLDRDGKVLLEKAGKSEAVLTAEETCVMNHLLQAVTEDGTARGLSLPEWMGIPVAGKTGTTQNNCDRWFIGYTPRLLCGVWMGYDYPAPLDGIDGNPCITIWDEVMSACERAYDGSPQVQHFPEHDRVIPVKICPISGEIATPECYEALQRQSPETAWFVEGTEPRDCCHLHFHMSEDILPDDEAEPFSPDLWESSNETADKIPETDDLPYEPWFKHFFKRKNDNFPLSP